MLRTTDLIVIVVYLIGSAAVGLWLSGRQTSKTSYFVGGRELPWWAVSLSIVATETSALTVISVPGIAFGGDLTYLQLALGYIIGRIGVAAILIPRYWDGTMVTAYTYLGRRFGNATQMVSSVAFLATRLLADGVRVFAAAIPMKVILDGFGVHLGYFWIIVILSLVTVLYTLIGGISAVVWVDVFQMAVYVAGGAAALGILTSKVGNFWADAADAGKTKFFDFTSNVINGPFPFFACIIGGALMAMGSHGVDQLVVQRVLACRSKRDGQKALIVSGFVVLAQFALFMVVGLGIWSYYGGKTFEDLGLATNDEVFPQFIVEALPAGLSGLLLAGILAAAMSTLSSSLNALSSSTVVDLVERARGGSLSDSASLKLSRGTTLVWGLVFIGSALVFENAGDSLVTTALSIASLTYGGLLGAFILGICWRRAAELDAIVGMVVAIGLLSALFVYDTWHTSPDTSIVSFTWYTGIGLVITMVIGVLLSFTHGVPQQPTTDDSSAGEVRA